jgi:hypothetical protein
LKGQRRFLIKELGKLKISFIIISKMSKLIKLKKPKKQTEEEREIENTGDTGIDFIRIFKEIFTK